MSQYGSWSVKGVDDRARAVAKEKARLEGITLGDYINNLLLDGHSEAGPRDFFETPKRHRPAALDSLAQRVEAAEARSTLAITGIDQSVLGLLARLENTENSTSAMAAEVERMIDELRETNESLHSKVEALESDDSGHQSLEAMHALEDALGKLASHVYEEGRLSQDESIAMKGRVEAGFDDLNQRVEGIEVKVETTLSNAAKRVEKAVEQAELRAEGTSRHLSERVSKIESAVATKLAKVDETDTRVAAVEGDVSAAITSMESTLTRIQDRLHRAESTTDTALKALEHTFASLDERIDLVAEMANPEKADAWRQELENRFDSLATDLRASVDQTRRQLADEIERAAAGAASPELMGELKSRIHTLESDDTALRLEGIGAQVSDLSAQLDKRVSESERRSASAIEQVGEQVATAIKHVQVRQEQGQRSLEEKVSASETRQETRLSDALCNVSDRLAEIQNQTATAVSPVQRAIISLASRLESLEDFNAPPLAETGKEDLPNLPELEINTTPIEMAQPTQPEEEAEAAFFDDAEPQQETLATSQDDSYASDESDFIESLPDFDEADASDEPDSEVDEDYLLDATAHDDPAATEISDDSTAIDPLAELGSWDESQQESRDSDVFSLNEADDDFVDLLPTLDDEELAHNTDDLEADTDEFDPTLDDPTKDGAADYLSRARNAAIAAASDPGRDAKGRLGRGRRSAASTAPKSKSGGSRKLPIIAAASAFAIAAAGAGGWIALRGKQVVADNGTPSIITKSDLAQAEQSSAPEIADEPSLTGIEFAEAQNPPIDETLFEEEGSAAGVEELANPAPVETALPIELPLIPAALTLQQAAENGNPIAQFQWGEARLEAQDLAAAAKFISLSAEQGLPAAQYRLAKLHERGIGVPRDFAQARAWTERAANGGNVKAMHDLAVFYADGEGGPQSYAAAAEWFRRAADFGIVDSQYNLAVLYENGLGISPSQIEALYWYEVASANGDASAPGNVATLRDALPLDQAQQAQRRASTWTLEALDNAANGVFGQQTWDRSSRTQIVAVQTVLNGLGYDAGTPDGLAGAGTRTAVRAFQADYGLETTGVINTELVDALNSQAQSLAG